MSPNKIEKLTPEQEALIPVYREKWRSILLSTERIDREKAAAAVQEAYALIGLSAPEIIFYNSPNEAWKKPWNWYAISEKFYLEDSDALLREVTNQLEDEVESKLYTEIAQQLQNLWREMDFKLCWDIDIRDDFCVQFNWTTPVDLANNLSVIDFCYSVLNISPSQNQWSVCQRLAQNCGWIFHSEGLCGICDRPTKLSFDQQQRLHAEGEPAIQFSDGYSLYSYHGVTLPEKYGKIHPNEWQAQWLLEEKNAELRRALIQGIGYSRLLLELQATELDVYQQYTLLQINHPVDIEPICLLKMTCPSTSFIHVLRVPPNLISAREAIRWVNWGIDPEDIRVQT
ncbi:MULTISPECIES: DUF6745 domain-containing protein [Nostocales]|uniref:DUF6745 domain-containing protein n=3 Tax=Nostocales TaxID=1161 RepID=A0A0C1R510_9CYAN|nr:hypothetical protein [Tolypothrix bouteillei]KAF3889100.1 hypothetical protein DA73_0400029185 [Tolypothrix bouteillei VB521301]